MKDPSETDSELIEEIRVLKERILELEQAENARERAEQALLESEVKYRTVVENSLAGVFIAQDGLLRFVNNRFCEIFGYAYDEMVDTLSPVDVTHPEDKNIVEEHIRRVFAGEPYDAGFTHKGVRKDGATITVNVLAGPMIYNGRPASSGTVYDITQQEKVEEQLRQKTALLEAQVNGSLDGIIIVNKDKKILQNQQVNDLFKIPRSIAESEDNEAQMEWVSRLVKNPERFYKNIAYRSAHPDKTIRDELELKDGRILDRYSSPIIGEDGKRYGRMVTFRDITASKRAAEALEENEAQLRSILRVAPVGIGTGANRIINHVNDALCAMTGYAQSELQGQNARFLYPTDEEFSLVGRENYRQIAEYGTGAVETRWLRKDGAVINVLLSSTPIDLEDPQKGVTFTALDVTEQKRSEEALKESEERYRFISENMMDVICLHETDSRYVYVSPSCETVLGYSPREVVGRSPYDFFEPEERERILVPSHRKVTHDQIPDTSVSRIRKKDGAFIWLETKVKPIFAPDGTLRYVLTASRDVTERKSAEEALRASREQLKAMFETASIGMAQADPQTGRWLRVNQKMCEITGYSSDELLAMRVPEITHPEDRELDWTAFQNVVNGKSPNYRLEKRYIRKDGEIVWVNVNMTVIRDGAGKPVHTIAAIEDITDRKRAGDQVKASLHEKEVLLKEIHHRVKNNLQVISSLLNLQSHRIHDPKDVDAFNASMDRIKSMALIHDKLYRSENLASIYFPGYVSDLVRGLVANYSTGKGIELDLRVDPISLNVDNAIPLGLIVNELVSNALKHAFSGGKQGKVVIGLHIEGSDAVLVVSDNGIGFPDGLDFANTESLGMQLVVTLVEQLEGTITLNGNQGTEFRIAFNRRT
jgi:PAS domain S-box-containing protein